MRRMIFVLALAVLAGSLGTAYAQTPNARVFNGGAGLILYTIKAASTADFEMVLNKTKEALMKSEKPERKQQAASAGELPVRDRPRPRQLVERPLREHARVPVDNLRQ